MSGPTQVGRLAMRQEGENWVAYYAMPDTMEGAIFLGAIHMGAVRKNQKRKLEFMTMMREVVADILEETTGVRPTWDEPHLAPEHERSGSA